jgi:hypothetical protein
MPILISIPGSALATRDVESRWHRIIHSATHTSVWSRAAMRSLSSLIVW